MKFFRLRPLSTIIKNFSIFNGSGYKVSNHGTIGYANTVTSNGHNPANDTSVNSSSVNETSVCQSTATDQAVRSSSPRSSYS